jgi:hypothetical protein
MPRRPCLRHAVLAASLAGGLLALQVQTASALTPPTQPPVESDLARGLFVADHPPEVRALDGRVVSISGFMLSTDPMGFSTDFILTRYTPVCAFCPPGAPNEAVQVTLTRVITPIRGLITVRGRLHLEKDATSGLFFRLDGAEIIARP